MNGTCTKEKKHKRITETKIVKKDAKTNEKSEVENTRRMVDLEEQTLAEEKKDIPADVYGEILSYLPASKLLTLKIVCKDWLQLITSSDFVRLHISRGNRSHIRVLITRHFSILECNNYYKKTTIRRIRFPAQFSGCTKILGSADGLTFLLDEVSGLTGIFNPSTRECFRIQLSLPFLLQSHGLKFYWFGKLGGTEEYILVMGVSFSGSPYAIHHEIWVYKYSRSSNIINRICSTQVQARGMPIPIYDGMRGTFVQGVIHWPFNWFTDNRYAVLAYDLGKKDFKEIPLPAECNSYNVRLGLFVDGCSLLATCQKSIWVMKDGCWTKYANVEESTIEKYSSLDPLGFLPNGDFIMEVNQSRLMNYSFTHKEASVLTKYDYYGNGMRMDGAIVCADTLLSPGC